MNYVIPAKAGIQKNMDPGSEAGMTCFYRY